MNDFSGPTTIIHDMPSDYVDYESPMTDASAAYDKVPFDKPRAGSTASASGSIPSHNPTPREQAAAEALADLVSGSKSTYAPMPSNKRRRVDSMDTSSLDRDDSEPPPNGSFRPVNSAPKPRIHKVDRNSAAYRVPKLAKPAPGSNLREDQLIPLDIIAKSLKLGKEQMARQAVERRARARYEARARGNAQDEDDEELLPDKTDTETEEGEVKEDEG